MEIMEYFTTQSERLSNFNESLQAHYDYGSRVQLVLFTGLLCAVYLHTMVRRLAPGLKAFVAILPVLVFNVWAPLAFHSGTELITRVVFYLLFCWLANFKAVGLCINRGPLASKQWNPLQVCLLYVLPLYPRQDGPVKKGRLGDSAGPTSKLIRLAAVHCAALSFVAYLLGSGIPLPTHVKNYCWALALYTFISFIMNGPAALLTSIAELDVVPPFDKPWMAESLAELWSRRWNNTVSLTLRALVYDPIVEGCLIHRDAAALTTSAAEAVAGAAPAGSAAAAAPVAKGQPPHVSPVLKMLGGAATFAVSGLMHEVALMYAVTEGERHVPGFWFMFFFSQVPLVVLEDIVRRRLRKAGIKLARPVGMGWTTAMLLFTAYYFWFPPIEQYSRIAVRMVEAVNGNAATAVNSLLQLLQQWGLSDAALGGAALVGNVGPASL